jgi:hypothetical protein
VDLRPVGRVFRGRVKTTLNIRSDSLCGCYGGSCRRAWRHPNSGNVQTGFDPLSGALSNELGSITQNSGLAVGAQVRMSPSVLNSRDLWTRPQILRRRPPDVDALAPIVRLNSRRPGIGRAKGILIFRPKNIRNPFDRVRFVVSGDVLGRHGRICHRCDNQSRAKQAKDRPSHDLSPSISLICRDAASAGHVKRTWRRSSRGVRE